MATLLLLTKEYPQSNKETYLNYEMPYLRSAFPNIIVVPIDYYRKHDAPATFETPVLQVNNKGQAMSNLHKLKMNAVCFYHLIAEMLQSRERDQYLKQFRFAFTYLKICYTQAFAIFAHLSQKESSQPTILYSYWFHRSALTGVMYKRHFDSTAHIISRAHSSDLYHKDWKNIIQQSTIPFMPFERLKVIGCDKIFTISEHGRKHLTTLFSKQSEKITVARLGVQSPHVINRITANNFFRIVTCSGITPNKRMYRIPEILYYLKKYHVEWVHFGGYTPENFALLKAEMKKHDVEHLCKINGWTSNSDILHYYATEQVNLLLNLSKAEGIPVSIMEAFSYGIPAIATNTVGNPEIVDSTCGAIVSIDFDAQDVAQHILLMLQDENIQKELRAGATLKFERLYDAANNYAGFTKILNQSNRFPNQLSHG